MLSRLIDYLKMQNITALCTDLTTTGGSLERTDIGVSSLMDTWFLLQAIEGSGERNRGLYILKSRGMDHSNQVREFRLTDQGAEILDVYIGKGGVLTGSSRLVQEARERVEAVERRNSLEAKRREIERKKALIEAQIAALRLEFEAEQDDLERAVHSESLHHQMLAEDVRAMARARQSDELVFITEG